jgi:hypothetical protein
MSSRWPACATARRRDAITGGVGDRDRDGIGDRGSGIEDRGSGSRIPDPVVRRSAFGARVLGSRLNTLAGLVWTAPTLVSKSCPPKSHLKPGPSRLRVCWYTRVNLVRTLMSYWIRLLARVAAAVTRRYVGPDYPPCSSLPGAGRYSLAVIRCMPPKEGCIQPSRARKKNWPIALKSGRLPRRRIVQTD